MRLNPHLAFPGNCAEALAFYENVFGTKVQFQMTYGDSPMAEHTAVDFRDKIMHASMLVGETVLMAADAPPGRYKEPQGIMISVDVSDPAEGKKIFEALSEGGTIDMPYQATFWAKGFGMVRDKYKTPWMVNCSAPMYEDK